LSEGSLEVIEEDAPGDAVDGEVMNNDEEAIGESGRARRGGGGEESETQQRAMGEVKAGLKGGGSRFDGSLMRVERKLMQVEEGERQRQGERADGGLPGGGVVSEFVKAEAQGIVLLH
jgi:hypothetical protein